MKNLNIYQLNDPFECLTDNVYDKKLFFFDILVSCVKYFFPVYLFFSQFFKINHSAFSLYFSAIFFDCMKIRYFLFNIAIRFLRSKSIIKILKIVEYIFFFKYLVKIIKLILKIFIFLRFFDEFYRKFYKKCTKKNKKIAVSQCRQLKQEWPQL